MPVPCGQALCAGGAGSFSLIPQARLRALPVRRSTAQSSNPSEIVTVIVWAREESSFLNIFSFSLFFLIFPPTHPFLLIFNGHQEGRTEEAAQRRFLLSLKRSELMAEGTSSSDRKKSPHHNNAVFPSQLWTAGTGQRMEKQRRGEGGLV